MSNIERKENYTQVCVWPGCIVDEGEVHKFEEWMVERFGVRAQYLEVVKTNPDIKDDRAIFGTGNRSDVFFAIHNEDVMKFAVPRLEYEMRWIEDVLAPCNHGAHLYPERVNEYKCWNVEEDEEVAV